MWAIRNGGESTEANTQSGWEKNDDVEDAVSGVVAAAFVLTATA
jgi:hypothetical protein